MDFKSLEEARQYVFENRTGDGVICPCCRLFAKEYERKMNSGMARVLIGMYRAHGLDWGHKPTTMRGKSTEAHDDVLLEHWGLMIPDPARPKKGWWRVTRTGERFIHEEIAKPKNIRTYGGEFLGYTGPAITIRDALGSHFSLEELMSK